MIAYFMTKRRSDERRFFRRGKSAAQAVLRDDTRHEEILQILATAGFGSCAGHFESTKGLAFDDGAGDRAIDIKIAANHFRFRALDVNRAAGVAAARQGKFAVVGERDGFVKILCFGDGQHWTENLFAE